MIFLLQYLNFWLAHFYWKWVCVSMNCGLKGIEICLTYTKYMYSLTLNSLASNHCDWKYFQMLQKKLWRNVIECNELWIEIISKWRILKIIWNLGYKMYTASDIMESNSGIPQKDIFIELWYKLHTTSDKNLKPGERPSLNVMCSLERESKKILGCWGSKVVWTLS